MQKSTEEIHKARPISPHLGIYKLQISSVLSVGHRLSGIGLFFYDICNKLVVYFVGI